MKKTCYFCNKLNPYECKKHKDVKYLPNQYFYNVDNCEDFKPTDDWNEYERLLEIEKIFGEEYEEYKKQEAKSPEQKQKEAKELHDLFYGKPTLPSFRKNRTIRINGVKYKIKDLSKLKSL